ncbi:hypothetical protein HBI56_204430 [Parastagonospora nodorum]|nr:hypothetical protein HBH53_075010 [Parastagonospora nodorum]KAH3965876.1 hypothetical protein HBH51_146740 [Parastagonospora nodorum]KAH3998810.1 hypothetical protein HBI10_123760 [Parastagonospora nodorum]KAH4024320.1 hypothetical protein HBI13_085770 [Parastagonospora nodorum]KAH4192204.1 hypothetical protein HBI95_208790 [Parastagonospora nodorum]
MAEQYMKGRSFITSIKMNYFHCFLKQLTGYNIHPSIELSNQKLRIADMGTQTAIWPIEVAEAFGPRAEVVAFDTSDRFTPPAPWLPPNLSIRIHDITLPFSEDLLGQFDVINFRLFLTLPPEKLNVMLANAMALLKPGGYIQWTEHDKTDLEPLSTNSSRSFEAVNALIALEKNPFPNYNAFWVNDIAREFTKTGLDVITEDRVKTRKSMLMQMNELHLLSMMDIQEGLSKAVDEFKEEHLDTLTEDFAHGVTSVDGFITIVGKKPL